MVADDETMPDVQRFVNVCRKRKTGQQSHPVSAQRVDGAGRLFSKRPPDDDASQDAVLASGGDLAPQPAHLGDELGNRA